jgi:RimJ/RimL family protein N-acetyltransferase
VTETTRAHPPERLENGPVVLRRYELDDAELLHDAITASVEHLLGWMPWAALEPLSVPDRRELIVTWREQWDAGEEFNFATFASGELVGGCGMHRRIGPGGLEIGYWTRAGCTGRGYATAAAGALTQAAFDLDRITHVEIHHDKANQASSRVPAKLGFVLVREVPDPPEAPAEVGISCEWRMKRPFGQSLR